MPSIIVQFENTTVSGVVPTLDPQDLLAKVRQIRRENEGLGPVVGYLAVDLLEVIK